MQEADTAIVGMVRANDAHVLAPGSQDGLFKQTRFALKNATGN
jgi:hypothetical protein